VPRTWTHAPRSVHTDPAIGTPYGGPTLNLAEITIPLQSHDEAMLVLGPYDRFAKLLRQSLGIEVYARTGNLRLKGGDEAVSTAQRRIEHVLGKTRKGRELDVREIEAILMGRDAPRGARHAPDEHGRHHTNADPTSRRLRVRPVEPRNEAQRRYIELIEKNPLVFGLGPAGTGKTYLAVSSAVRQLRRGEVRRLVITRPVVEAGEHLGCLPGDLQQKLDPYMRPIYDALFDLIDKEDLARLEEAGVIEVAPLAYMRGRTLSQAFVILDEAQNTTLGQMKMFLTRMGEGSHVCVTGDPSQNDLPVGKRSGLVDAVQRLRGFDLIGVQEFTADDVVRHPLVARIVRAYQAPARGAEEDEA
jgi:phosphate starvation-inducible PhoH-like protein